MGDMGDMYRDWKAIKKAAQAKNKNLKIIDRWIEARIPKLKGCVRDMGGTVLFRIEGKPKVDFYPTKNKWCKGKVIYYGDAEKFLNWYEKQSV